MKMLIVKGNFRADILLIYKELEFQIDRKGWGFDNFIPYATKWLYPSTRSSPYALFQLIKYKYLKILWRDRNFFFRSGRPRLWRILDFLASIQILQHGYYQGVFLINQRHSPGLCHAARIRQIPIITHQHGDYYTPRSHFGYPFRDVEGAGTTRLVWDESSLKMIKAFSPEGNFIISGSLKHVAMQRSTRRYAHSKAIVFMETIFQDFDQDRSVSFRTAMFLNALARRLGRSIEVAMHPLRDNRKEWLHDRAIERIYTDFGIRRFFGIKESSDWAICSDSTALFDVVVSGVPCILLEREDSLLSIKNGYPGRIGIEAPNAIADIALIIDLASNRKDLSSRQLSFLMDTKIGSPTVTNAAFDLLLDKLSW